MDLVDRGDRLALRLARCSWGWWRPPAQRAEGHLMLPRAEARRLARKGGRVQIERVSRGRARVGRWERYRVEVRVAVWCCFDTESHDGVRHGPTYAWAHSAVR